MRARIVAIVSTLVVFGLVLVLVMAARAHPGVGETPRVLLVLGDSIGAGYQPTDGQAAPPIDRGTGYSDLGYAAGYAADLAVERHLSLVNLACPGETVTSMSSTPAKPACEKLYRGEFHEGSQQAAAAAYLADNRGAVALVTIDIGANDFISCASAKTGSVNRTCLAKAVVTIGEDLPKILGPLARELKTDDPGARFLAMNYYDPFLALAINPGGDRGLLAAEGSLVAVGALNTELATIYHRAGLQPADVATAYSTSSELPLVDVDGHLVPYSVKRVCTLTWMCPASGSSTAANIHPNDAGYRLIATTFEGVLDKS